MTIYINPIVQDEMLRRFDLPQSLQQPGIRARRLGVSTSQQGLTPTSVWQCQVQVTELDSPMLCTGESRASSNERVQLIITGKLIGKQWFSQVRATVYITEPNHPNARAEVGSRNGRSD